MLFNGQKDKNKEEVIEEGQENEDRELVSGSEKSEEKEWFEEDSTTGGLSIDVYEEGDYLVVKSTIAGVKPEDVDVVLDGDMLYIKGKRKKESQASEENYFYQECYWGSFERALKLPIQVESANIEAKLRNGILTVRLRKARKAEKMSVKVKEE